MDNLTPITREEMLMNDEPLTPITREEKILAGEDLNPVTRREYFLKKYRHAGGDVMVEGLSVTENGTYTAPEGKAYSPVEVAVPLPENAYLLKTASGSLVSFNDGADLPMPSFVCDIDAQQDLHGYDGPWVGGAGKNKFPILIGDDVWVGNQGATYTSSNEVLIIESLAPTITSSGVYSSSNSKMRELVATLDGEYVYSFEIKCNKEASITCGISNHGNIARTVSTNWVRYEIPTTFSIGENAGCVFYNYSKTENLEIQVRNFMIQQGTTATPYETYENICPISGHIGVNAWLRGKNLLPMTVDGIKNLNTTGTWVDETYTINGAEYKINTDNAGNITSINARSVAENPSGHLKISATLQANSYILSSGFSEINGVNDTLLQKNGVTIARGNNSSPGSNFTLEEASEVTFSIRLSRNDSSFVCYPMIRLSTETDATYEPYNQNSQTIQVSWQTEAGEVYGGYVDLVSGVLTVTDGYIASYDGEILPSTWISDSDVYAEGTTPTTGAEVVYKLAEAQTYQLTPTQIKSLLGTNNAWCDTGDVDIDYFAKEVTG